MATAVDGITDVVPANAAVLVTPEDPAAVSAAISRILAEDGLADGLRRSALAAASAWRPERMLTLYCDAYQAARAGQQSWA